MKYLNKARSDYASTNEKISSGKRFDRISQDVIAGTKVLRVRTEMCKAETQYNNVKSAQEELSTTELAMTSINNILTSASSEKINAALSEEKGEAGRTAIANEIEAMRNEILQYVNTKYNSRYVFGGSNSSYTAPFSLNSDGRLLYNGIDVDLIQQDVDGSYFYDNAGVQTKINLDTDVYLDIGLGIKLKGNDIDPNTGFKISYSGLEILGFGTNADGMSNNIFNVLTEIENNIRNYDSIALNEKHAHLRTLCDSFRANLTNIGAKTNLLETMEDRLKNSLDGYKSRVNTLMGINDAEEAMNQSMNEYVLKAVIQMGAKILPVSLMDFLR
jgi:flagellin-like hook-associated protein FlgL